jgi:predicted MPP superfamily phosphohydrolase
MKKGIKILVIILAFIAVFVGTYFYAKFFGTIGLNVNEYLIKSENISKDYDGLKVVHLSDIHFDDDINVKNFKKIIDNVNLHKPDIIVFTGDLISDHISNDKYEELVDIMTNLEASIGKYAIDGNHDYKYKKWNQLIEDCGFINLNDSYEVIYTNSYDSIFIAGISNNTYTTKNIEDKSEIIFDYLNSDEYNSTYNILLMHEPDFVTDIDYKMFDIVMAGHSHNGQVRIPFFGAIYTPTHAKKYYKPYYDLGGTKLYISSGIGTSELPVRLFNKPSYNLYRITKK